MRTRQSGIALKDLLLEPHRSYNYNEVDILEGERKFSRADTKVDLTVELSPSIKLTLPILSAGMHDVTDEHIAEVFAQQGGIGVLPPTYTVEQQAAKVRKVKRVEGGFLEIPYTLTSTDKVAKILDADYSNIPIIDNAEIVGMFQGSQYTKQFYEMRKESTIAEFMEKDLSRITIFIDEIIQNGGLSFKYAGQIMKERMISALAIIDRNKRLKYLVTMKDMDFKENKYPLATRDQQGRLMVGAAVFEYYTPENLDRIQAVVDAGADLIVIEQAHGWNCDVGKMTRHIRECYPYITVIAGNDSVGAAVVFHKNNQAHAAKIGNGPGDPCSTDEEVGLWRPQASAVCDCALAAKEIRDEYPGEQPITIIADGGIKHPYHGFIGFASGADALMIGSLVAATSDSPAKEIQPGIKEYRGSGSLEMYETNQEAYKRYHEGKEFVAEGKVRHLPKTGTCEEFLKRFHSKLNKIFERYGTQNIAELHERLWSGELRAQCAHDHETR